MIFNEETPRAELRVRVIDMPVPEFGILPGTHLSVEVWGVGDHRFGGMSCWIDPVAVRRLRDTLSLWLDGLGS